MHSMTTNRVFNKEKMYSIHTYLKLITCYIFSDSLNSSKSYLNKLMIFFLLNHAKLTIETDEMLMHYLILTIKFHYSLEDVT